MREFKTAKRREREKRSLDLQARKLLLRLGLQSAEPVPLWRNPGKARKLKAGKIAKDARFTVERASKGRKDARFTNHRAGRNKDTKRKASSHWHIRGIGPAERMVYTCFDFDKPDKTITRLWLTMPYAHKVKRLEYRVYSGMIEPDRATSKGRDIGPLLNTALRRARSSKSDVDISELMHYINAKFGIKI